LDVGVKGYDLMALVLPPAEKNVAYNYDEPASRHKNPQALFPAFVKLVEELFVVCYLPKLAFAPIIVLQSPI
jgi:hypothetical protein